LDEVDDVKASHPIYVLVFGDEEEREVHRKIAVDGWPQPWYQYAGFQLERGDEALINNFGIDIRILGFLEWDSDDGTKCVMVRARDPTGTWSNWSSSLTVYISSGGGGGGGGGVGWKKSLTPTR
jgi:hypothetical protein